jgi:hypothetical protein
LTGLLLKGCYADKQQLLFFKKAVYKKSGKLFKQNFPVYRNITPALNIQASEGLA